MTKVKELSAFEFFNVTSLEMEIGVEAESMHVPRPSQQTASMDSSRIEVRYYNDMHACMHLCIATIFNHIFIINFRQLFLKILI